MRKPFTDQRGTCCWPWPPLGTVRLLSPQALHTLLLVTEIAAPALLWRAAGPRTAPPGIVVSKAGSRGHLLATSVQETVLLTEPSGEIRTYRTGYFSPFSKGFSAGPSSVIKRLETGC